MTSAPPEVLGSDAAPPVEGESAQSLLIRTARGELPCLLHAAPDDAASAVVWTGGFGGGLRHPIYRVVAERLAAEGIESLRLRARVPGDLYEAVYDVEAGIAFLEGRGRRRFAVVGHSLGGAVAISAGERSPAVVAVAALASQTYGARGAAYLAPRCSLLLIHGVDDTRLGPHCSEQIYSWARKPKELVLLEGAGHSLLERKDDVCAVLARWLPEKLGPS